MMTANERTESSARPAPVTVEDVRRSTAKIKRHKDAERAETERRKELIRAFVIDQGHRPSELVDAAGVSAEHIARLARGWTSGKHAQPYGRAPASNTEQT